MKKHPNLESGHEPPWLGIIGMQCKDMEPIYLLVSLGVGGFSGRAIFVVKHPDTLTRRITDSCMLMAACSMRAARGVVRLRRI